MQACPNGSVEFRLRPPGIELWTTHNPSVPELSLLAMLGGAVVLHDLPTLATQLGLQLSSSAAAVGGGVALGGGQQLLSDWDLKGISLEHIGVSFVILAAPGLVAWGVDAMATRNPFVRSLPSRLFQQTFPSLNNKTFPFLNNKTSAQVSYSLDNALANEDLVSVPEPAPFSNLAYGYLPLVWASTLAHYLPSLMGEAGLVLRVTGAMFSLPSSWIDSLPTLTAHPAVIRFHCGWDDQGSSSIQQEGIIRRIR